MVIGSGLIARIFKNEFEDDKDVIVYASGVSNSGEKEVESYQRELNLLKSFEKTDAKLIYFSTVSVFDPTLQQSAYIRHKLEIEKYISSRLKNYIIFRLPIVIGHSRNPNTLTNFLFQKIQNQENFFLHQHAQRYILDSDDVGKFLSPLIRDSSINRRTLNIHFEKPISAPELVSMLEKIARQDAIFEVRNEGSYYSSDNSFFLAYLKRNDFVISPNYVFEVLKKYYGEE